jgi:predicted membrane-bound spermidine synthase
VVFEDPISYIRQTQALYDVVLLVEKSPSTFLSSRYLTREFFRDLKKALSPDGLLAIQTAGGGSYMIDELRLMLSTIHRTLRQSFRSVGFVPGENLILLASDWINPSDFTPSQMIAILQKRGLETRYLSPYALQVKYHPARVRYFQEVFEGGNASINSVNKPIIVHQAISYETAIFDPSWGTLWSYLGKIPTTVFFGVILVPLISLLLFFGVSKRIQGSIIPLTIGTTGIAGMVGSMAITIFFQALLGTLYLKMGLVFSSFMLGTFVAAFVISRESSGRHMTGRSMLWIESSMALYFLVLALLLSHFSVIQAGPATLLLLEISLHVLNFLLGCIVGAEFPIANSLMQEEGFQRESGGLLYAFDLVGAFVGSIVVVTFLLPLLGFLTILLLMASLKFLNTILVFRKTRLMR